MTEDEYNAMLFAAASKAVHELPDQICRLIRAAKYRMPCDNEIDNAVSRAIASRYADYGRCWLIDDREGNA